MPNAWVEHIKQFAKRKGLSYGCALSNPECKAQYYTNKTAPARFNEEMGREDINRAGKAFKKPKPKISATSKVLNNPDLMRYIQGYVPKNKKVVDIIRRKFDGTVYYYNRFHDSLDCYGIVDNKVMIIGEVGDYNSLDLFEEPKPVASNVRFYNDAKKSIKILNDLQEKKKQ